MSCDTLSKAIAMAVRHYQAHRISNIAIEENGELIAELVDGHIVFPKKGAT